MWRTILGEAWRAVASARRATVSSLIIITLCLTILGVLSLFALALDHEAREARRWITVEVFIRDEIPDERIPALRTTLLRLPTVADARLITRKEAVERFRRFFDPALIDVVESNPLPRSLVVELSDAGRSPAALRSLAAEVGKWPEVEAVQADVEWLTMLDRLVAGAAITIAALLLGIGVALSIVIARTIGLGISARLPVVEVQRLLGASERVVRSPFVVVGLGQGLIGGALAGAFVMAGAQFAGLLPLVGDRLTPELARATALGLVTIGAILGLWGSRSALSMTLPPDPWVLPSARRQS